MKDIKFRYWKYHLIRFISYITTGSLVSIKYEGELNGQVSSTSFLHYRPFLDDLVINWNTKEVIIRERDKNI